MFEELSIITWTDVAAVAIIFLVSILAGAGFVWLDRKIKARLQSRVGPPFYQQFADVLKLFFKESVIPREAHRKIFLIIPIGTLAGALTILISIPIATLYSSFSITGDLLVILFLMLIQVMSLSIAGYLTKSPYGSLGSAREITQSMIYKLPLIIIILTIGIKTGSLTLYDAVSYQQQNGWLLFSLFPSALAFLLIAPMRLAKSPFDIPNANSEVIEGPLTEYSGRVLAFYEVSKWIEHFVFPALFAIIFLSSSVHGGIADTVGFFAKTTIVFAAIVIADVSSARLKLNQAIKFYWGFVTLLSVLGLAMAM